tara:strand:+ start:995 stop:1507 length:513 start_codon:yes stop_codon:yes gene_type:complete
MQSFSRRPYSLLLYFCGVLILFSQSVLSSGPVFSEQDIEELRQFTKPVGIVCRVNLPCHEMTDKVFYEVEPVSQEVSSSASDNNLTGEAIYNRYCFSCHAAGIAGAPRFGDSAAWESRLAKGESVLHSNTRNGINAMPPRGLCISCTDEELEASVNYMIDAAGVSTDLIQ